MKNSASAPIRTRKEMAMDQKINESTRHSEETGILKNRLEFDTIARWPSGRKIRFIGKTNPQTDCIEIINPDGQLNIVLRFDSSGTTMVIPNGRIGLVSPEIDISCNDLSFEVKNDVKWNIGGNFEIVSQSISAKTIEDIEMNGRFIKLNCTETKAVQETDIEAQNLKGENS